MTLAAASLLFPLWVAAASPVVAVDAADPVLRGALALALVEDGAVVVPASADAGVTLRALSDGAGLQLAALGASERAAAVAAGAPALVELEAIHRAIALVRATPPRPAEAPAAVFLDVDDRAAAVAASPRLAESLAAALLDAAVPLAAPAQARERLCVMATASELTLSWGSSAARCEGRQMGVARASLSPRSVVDDALRLRDAAAPARPWRLGSGALASGASSQPALVDASSAAATTTIAASPAASAPVDAPPLAAPPLAAPPQAEAVPASDTPAAPGPAPSALVDAPRVESALVEAPPVESAVAPPAGSGPGPSLDVRLGALGRPVAVDPLLEAELRWPLSWPADWPLLREQGVGPAAWLAFTGALEPLPLAELALGGGVGGAWRLGDEVELGGALVLGALFHGWRYASDDAGVALDALAAAPLSLSWRPGPFGATLALTPGLASRARAHQIQGVASWERGALFLGISAGLTWDIPAGGGAVENLPAHPRGEGDG